ncbi:ATP synthase subunit I [Bacillus alkalicellulosilyticus]|uniref:ATP synthase subunit I n=1 Tax=Alkalihalobacterium alkalicellulosilyticum TaxID=1912214 RepID=UPI0009983D23|nr:ATP synthase subunit I [Bacillus alkalicellulosilyticus]
MTSLQQKMKGFTIVTAIFILLFLIGYIITPYQSHFLGLVIGLSFSYINLCTIYIKTKVVGDRAAGMSGKAYLANGIASFGMLIRFGLAVCAVALAVSFPETIDLISVITGLALIYIFLLIDMTIEFIRKR